VRTILRKIEGSSLAISIIISTIIFILCFTLILINYSNRQIETISFIDYRQQKNIESATNLILSDTQVFRSQQEEKMFLFNEDSIHIRKSLWGIFQSGCVSVVNGRYSKHRAFLYGLALPEYMRGCIYLADHQRSLSLVGSTKLNGDLYTSLAGVKAGYINQRGFEYTTLVNGAIRKSDAFLPSINNAAIEYLNDLTDTSKLKPDGKGLPDILNVKFIDPAFHFGKSGPIRIVENKLQGHIIIQSDSLIEVESTSELKSIILVAPTIIFRPGFRGNIQAFATNHLVVGDNCQFSYPSSLVLLKKTKSENQNSILIGENCRISGFVLSLCQKDDQIKSYVEIANKTEIQGVVYVNGYLNLNADINGTVLTDYFIHKTKTATYENHLVDVEVNRNNLSEHFLGSYLFNLKELRQIVQWLE